MINGGDPRQAKKSLSKKSGMGLSPTYEFKITQLCQRERPNIDTLKLNENLYNRSFWYNLFSGICISSKKNQIFSVSHRKWCSYHIVCRWF